MSDFDPEELEEFKVESVEMLDEGETHLLAIDRGEDFLTNYDAIFRVFHSLKGAAGMLGLEALQGHMHRLETLLSDCKKIGKITKDEVTYFLKGVDAARGLLDGQEVDFDPTPPSAEPAPKADEPTKTLGKGLIFASKEASDDVQKILSAEGFEVNIAADLDQLQKLHQESPVEFVLTDQTDAFSKILETDPDLPIVCLKPHGDLKNLDSFGVILTVPQPVDPYFVVNQCFVAIRLRSFLKLFSQSVDFSMLQFPDLEDFLQSQGKETLRNTMKEELGELLKKRQNLRKAA